MDILSILTAIGASGVISGLLTWLGSRRKDAAQVSNLKADYTDKILQQSNERAAQYKADADQFRKEREEAREEAKGQRRSKQEWRDKYLNSEKRTHELELSVKDVEARIAEERWHRCEVNGCDKRMPPRDRNK